jgi:hypothetical protein
VIPITFLIALVALTQASLGRTVLATVLDQRNRPVVDVDIDDFVVREAGRSREVLSAVVVLVDTSGQAREEFESIRQAAIRFITRIGPRPVGVVTTGSSPTLIASFDDARDVVLQRLRALVPEQDGRSQALQGMAAAARSIRALEVPFSTIVVLSTSPETEVGDAPTEWLRQIIDSRAIVEVIVHQSGAATPLPSALKTLTEQTKGRLTTIFAPASFTVALDRLADQMAGEMMVDYLVPAGDVTPQADVTVGVRQPGLHVKGLGVR